MTRFSKLAVAAVAALGLGAGSALAQETIKIGTTMPYSGPASAYGVIGKAMEAYFDKVNAEGGINGRMIEFVNLDDGYSPPRTVEQVRRMVERDNVDLLTGTLGTPTNSAIHRYMNERAKIPHLFLATGASKWDNPEEFPWTTGFQPSYAVEGRIYAQYLIDNHPDAKIAVLYQNDDYGKDYFEPFKEHLEAAGKGDNIIMELPYEVTDPTIDNQILQFKDSGATVFFNVTTPKFAAQAIRLAFDSGWKPEVHLLNNVSSSIDAVIRPAGIDKAQGILSTLWNKDPNDARWEGDEDLAEYRKFFEEYYEDGNIADAFNVTGYMIAYATVETLKRVEGDVTPDSIMAAVHSFTDGMEVPMALPGLSVAIGPDDHAPFEGMQIVRFEGEGWDLVGDPIVVD